MEGHHNDDGITLSAPIFYLLLSTAGLGGAGVFGAAGLGLDKDMFEQCVDQSEVALKVAEQHGQELLELRGQIYQRTQSRYTADDAEIDMKKQGRIDDIQDRRLQLIENHIAAEERQRD